MLNALATAAVAFAAATAPAPADFSTTITNPYMPMRPGSRWVYRTGSARDVVKVTDRTKLTAGGIVTRVVHDVTTEHGRPVEITDDYYAQDRKGNVWYLGEATTTYEHGKPQSTEGSFEDGVDGAKGGIIMPAHPKVGMRYHQEDYKGHAEDRAKVVSRHEHVRVPKGRYDNTLMTLETSPLEPDVLEAKFYARGVGPVLAVDVSGGTDREELLRFRRGRG
jgi:hypothetical protein